MSQRQTNATVQTFNHVCEECSEAVCEIILVFCFPSTETVSALLLCVSLDPIYVTQEVTYMCFYVRHSMQKVVMCRPLVAAWRLLLEPVEYNFATPRRVLLMCRLIKFCHFHGGDIYMYFHLYY